MKKFTLHLGKKMFLLAICFAFMCGTASATIFTAVLSGDFGSLATWGGVAPGGLISADEVIIPPGITVTLSTPVTFSGTSSLLVNGTLTAAGSSAPLILTSGSLSGTGTITVDSMVLGLMSGITFTGSITAMSLTSTGADISSAATVTINKLLNLTSGSLDVAAGSLDMGAGSTINLSGGTLTTSGTGMLGLASSYNVMYTLASATSGMELSGAGLDSITVNVPGAVTLSGNQTVNGTLMLTSGALALNGNTLTISPTGNVAAGGAGTLTGSASSNLIINAMGSLAGALNFTTGGNMLDNLTVNSSTGSMANLGSGLTVDGLLTLTSGSLGINGHTLTLASTGNLASGGAGTLSGSAASNLVINTTGSLTGALNFAASGDMLNNLTLNSSTGSMANLASNLTIDGLLTLTAGSLGINGHTLTLGSTGNLAAGGSGTLNGSATSNLVIGTTGSLTGTLDFATGGNMLNNLTLSSTTGSVANLGSDLTIDGIATMTSGSLGLNGHVLTLGPTSNIAAGGSGTLTGSSTSNLIINATGSLTGTLNFATGGNILNNLNLNSSAGSVASLGADVMLDGLLTLTSGALSLNGHTLTLGTTGNLAAGGSGTITGSAASSLIINTTGSLSNTLNFTAGGNMLNNLTLNSSTGSMANMGTDLTVDGLMTLTSGTLELNGHTLTLGASSNLAAGGVGSLTGSATSSLVVDATGGLTGTLNFATGGNMLNNLTVNATSGSMANLGSDLTVNGLLTLTSGSLGLNGHSLTLSTTGNIATGGTGSLNGSTTSNVIINATSGLTGALNFATSGDMVNNLTLNLSTGSMANLGSGLTVDGTLTLTSGLLGLNGHTLTLGTAGNIAAGGSGTIMGSATSGLVINTTSSLSNTLNFAAGGNMLNNLTVNSSTGSTANLGSGLSLNGMLSLMSGALGLNGHTLTLSSTGNVAAGGSGSLSGSSSSNLIINTTGSLAGTLNFTTGAMLNNLTVNMGTAGDIAGLGSGLTVNGTLNLMNGKITLGANNLEIAAGGALMGGNANSYIVTDGTGTLTMNLVAAATDSFQVGTMSNYAPMALSASTGSAAGDVSINVINGVYSDGYSGTWLSATEKMVNATWYVSSTATGSFNLDMVAMWSAGMGVNGFDPTAAYISHYTSGAWDTETPMAAAMAGGMYSVSRTGITSLSPFMVTNANTNTGVQNISAGAGSIVVYPNPVAGTLYFSDNAAIETVCLYDMMGQKVKSANAADHLVSVQELPAGEYFINFTGKNLNSTQKFTKQ